MGEMAIANKALVEMTTQMKTFEEEEDYLRHTVAELSQLDVQKGDDDSLDAHRRLMQSAIKIKVDVSKSLEAISGGWC